MTTMMKHDFFHDQDQDFFSRLYAASNHPMY